MSASKRPEQILFEENLNDEIFLNDERGNVSLILRETLYRIEERLYSGGESGVKEALDTIAYCMAYEELRKVIGEETEHREEILRKKADASFQREIFEPETISKYQEEE